MGNQTPSKNTTVYLEAVLLTIYPDLALSYTLTTGLQLQDEHLLFIKKETERQMLLLPTKTIRILLR